MQFPRYEFVIPRYHEPDRHRRPRRPRAARAGPRLRPLPQVLFPRRRPRPLLEIHEYLELEFAVKDAREWRDASA